MQHTAPQLKTLRVKAKRVVEGNSKASLGLSQMVWETKHAQLKVDGTEAWAHWGFESWEEYLRADLQMGMKTAIDHLRVWEIFGIHLKGKWNRRKVLPFNKMHLIAMMALSSGDINALLDACRNKSPAEIRAMISSKPCGRPVVHLRTTSFTLNQDMLEEYLGHLSTMRVVHSYLSRGELVLIALRYYIQHAPDVKGLTQVQPRGATTKKTAGKARRKKGT